MAVYYKFKSAKDFDSVRIDGLFISVANLKEKIFETKHLGRGTDYDLMVSNAQTNEEYPDPDTLILKNTSVLVRRIPGRPRMPIVTEREETKAPVNKEEESQPTKSSFFAPDASAMTFPEETEWDEFGNDLYAIPEVPPGQYSNQAQDAPPPNRDDEDSKIKALIDTPALDWQQQVQDGFGSGRGFGRGMGGRMMGGRGVGRGLLERKTPPPGYICHRCKVPGHFIQHCPTNGDPNFDVKKTKPPTGIPRSMLVPTPDGSYALPSGAVAVMKPNEAVFEKEIEGLPCMRSMNAIPLELRCPLCKKVMQDAVLTSKCCFKSFCDTCIRNHIISKLACACGEKNVLADDLLPNKTVRETINRFLESNNSSAENAGSMLQVQDMESARPAQPKVPSPTLSASSRGEQITIQSAQLKAPAPTHSASLKGEQRPPIQKDDSLDMQEPGSKAKDAGVTPLSLGKGRDAKNVDACEATFDSILVKGTMPQGIALLDEEDMQQKPSASEPGKKKKKKARLPPNELQWRTSQYIGGEKYMMPFPPPAGDLYWGNMQLGMDGFMNPYNGTMPYMGYVPGPFDPMGGMLPQDHFGGPGYTMPGFPHQRYYSDFSVGSSLAPLIMSRAEFEARKADSRRRRDLEGRVKRIGSRDPEYGRNVSNDGDISSLRSEHRMMSKGKNSDHHQRHYHHPDEKESIEDRSHHYRVEKESSQDRSCHHRVERESNLDRSYHHHHRSHYHRDERQLSLEQDHHNHRQRRTENPLHDAEPVRHVKKRFDHHNLPPLRDLEPVRKRRAIEQEDTVTNSGEDTADKKQKASVFSRISFPGEIGGNKKRKVPSHLSNRYKNQTVKE